MYIKKKNIAFDCRESASISVYIDMTVDTTYWIRTSLDIVEYFEFYIYVFVAILYTGIDV